MGIILFASFPNGSLSYEFHFRSEGYFKMDIIKCGALFGHSCHDQAIWLFFSKRMIFLHKNSAARLADPGILGGWGGGITALNTKHHELEIMNKTINPKIWRTPYFFPILGNQTGTVERATFHHA